MTTRTSQQILSELQTVERMLNSVMNAGVEDVDLTLEKIGHALLSGDTHLIPTCTAKAIIDCYRMGLEAKRSMLLTDAIMLRDSSCLNGNTAA